MVVIDDPIAAKAAFTISIDGTALRNDQFSINAYGGASLQIDLNDRVYNDQTLTVAYNPADLNDNAGELKDNNGNFVASFNQLIDTSAIADSAPDLQAPVLTASSTSGDGQTISLNFSEELSGHLDNNTFQISLNGRDIGMGAVETPSPKPSMPMALPPSTSHSSPTKPSDKANLSSSPTTRPSPLRSSPIPLAIQLMRSSKPSITPPQQHLKISLLPTSPPATPIPMDSSSPSTSMNSSKHSIPLSSIR